MSESPQERVDYYVESHVRHARKIGADVNLDQVRSGTARLLELADAENRAGSAALKQDDDGKTAAEVRAAKLAGSPATLAEQSGGELIITDLGDQPIAKPRRDILRPLNGHEKAALRQAMASAAAVMDRAGLGRLIRQLRKDIVRLRGVELEKHLAMVTRFYMLLAPIPGYRLKPGEAMDHAYQFPAYWSRLTMTSQHKDAGVGAYAGLTKADRERLFITKIEQICTESDAVIGYGWWIPK